MGNNLFFESKTIEEAKVWWKNQDSNEKRALFVKYFPEAPFNILASSDSFKQEFIWARENFPIAGHAPGNYSNTCVDCEELFLGDKKSIRCRSCATKKDGEAEFYNKDEVRELFDEFCKELGIEDLNTHAQRFFKKHNLHKN